MGGCLRKVKAMLGCEAKMVGIEKLQLMEVVVRVEMLSTGDEVLHGQIVDSNAAWLAAMLFETGLPLTSRTTVGDSLAELTAMLTERSQQAEVLIVNGGLGPTSDDLTALAAAQAAGVGLVRHATWLKVIETFFAQRGQPMAAINAKQADIPAGATIIDNQQGTACGFYLQLNRCHLFFTPGPPHEFKAMVSQQILPRLTDIFTLPAAPISQRLTTFGWGESDIAERLAVIDCPDQVAIGYRAAAPIVEVKLTGPASRQAEITALWQQIRHLLSPVMLFEGVAGFPAEIASLLTAKGYQLSLCEGFTAGYLHWLLRSAQAPIVDAQLLRSGQALTTQQAMHNYRSLHLDLAQQLKVVIDEISDQHRLTIGLLTPDGDHFFHIQYSDSGASLVIRQQVIAWQALYLLQRWLNQQPMIIIHHGLKLLDVGSDHCGVTDPAPDR